MKRLNESKSVAGNFQSLEMTAPQISNHWNFAMKIFIAAVLISSAGMNGKKLKNLSRSKK